MPADVNQQAGEGITHVSQRQLIRLNQAAHSLDLHGNQIRSSQSGQYLSRIKGRGMEFDEARPYQPGDDIRAMDWRVTARTGKPHTKIFREERERPMLLWVDYRQPMAFATQGVFKSVIAAELAALLGWACAFQGDRLGGLIFSETRHYELRPRRGKAATLHFLQQLVEHQPELTASPNQEQETTTLDQALIRLNRVTRPGSLVFLISDFRDLSTHSRSHLSRLAAHSDVMMLAIADNFETQLPPAGNYPLNDGLNQTQLNTADQKFREKYAQRFHQHHQQLQQLCKKLGIRFWDVFTHHDTLLRLQQGLGIVRT